MGALQSAPAHPEYVDLAEKTGCEYRPCLHWRMLRVSETLDMWEVRKDELVLFPS